LQVKRIDHGNRAFEDADLVQRMVRDQVPMTICPLSNKRLQVCPDLTHHPLKRMLRAGLLVTVNSDDPSYFGGYITDNFLEIAGALELDRNDIIQLGRNAFVSSFLNDQEKQTSLDAFDQFVERFSWK
jgi:adenosine deaminase